MALTGLRVALDLTELGERLLAQRYRREHPEASEAEIRQVIAEWYAARPMAPEGDGVGRVVAWPR